MSNCVEHLVYAGETCPDCNLPVDEYGNTEAEFQYCCFPNCGCDGSRLCMAPSGASGNAVLGNIEGKWSSRTKESKKARIFIMGLCRPKGGNG